MRKIILSSIAAVSVSVTAAYAGGIVEPVILPAPVVVPVASDAQDWTGFFGGLQFGSAKLKTSEGLPDPTDPPKDGLPPFAAGRLPSSLDSSGRHYGVHIGYLHDFGRFVGGAELAYSKLQGFEAQGADVDGSMVTGKLLAGYDAGRLLPYVTVGYGRVELDSSTGSNSETGTGYGVGVKYLATPKIMIGAELMRYDFDWSVSKYQNFLKSDYVDGEAKVDKFSLSISYRF